MSRAPIGIVLGPRPGIAACSFKQGMAEIVLRSLISVSSMYHCHIYRIRLVRVKLRGNRSTSGQPLDLPEFMLFVVVCI